MPWFGAEGLDKGQMMIAPRARTMCAARSARSPRPAGSRFAVFIALLTLLLALGPFALRSAHAAPGATSVPLASSGDDWAPPSTVYIPDTGETIDGVFLDYWRANGGVNAFGNPITQEFQLNGHTVQYYEYARFEYWPEDVDGNVVHLGKIGEELRPQLVMRQGTVATAPGSVAQQAKISLAWLPVSQKIASTPESDTFTYISATGHTIANGFKNFWDSTGGADYLGNPLTEEYKLGDTTYQVFERGQLAWKQGNDPWMVAIGDELAARQGISTAPVDQGDVPTYDESLFVEPTPDAGNGVFDPNQELWFEVNLSEQYMTVWNGDHVLLGTYVSTGVPGLDTPTGTFYVNSKLESQTMEGVIGGEYYNVPDVPWVMYFTDEGHALHGTYWHSNFGTPMSHGCVNLPMDVAEYLYSITPIGTRVEIHY
jgi:lipoprotein-anchoring transpeptidase ErfK/SrfK